MELGHAREVRQEPRRGLAREGTTVVDQMHLIVEVVIVGDLRPRQAGQSELVIQGGVESQAPIALPGVDADRQRSRLLRSDAFGPRLSCLHGRVPFAVPGAPRGRARVPYVLRD